MNLANNEIARYGFWGVITVIVNYLSYVLFEMIFPYQVANLCSIILTKVFAYYTNKRYVFRTNTGIKEQTKEIVRYIVGRAATGLVDFGGLIVLAELFSLDDKIGKIIMIVITTLLNYFFGKLFIFKIQNKTDNTGGI